MQNREEIKKELLELGEGYDYFLDEMKSMDAFQII